MKLYSYNSIPVFRTFFAEMIDRAQYAGKDSSGNAIFDRSIKLPVINLRGSIKLHGKNASIVYTKDGLMYSQSRETILDEKNNLDGFYEFAKKQEEFIKKEMSNIIDDFDAVVIYGEWCGPGVQKGSAIANIPRKSYFLFSVIGYKGDTRFWLSNDLTKKFKCEDIYSIYEYGTYGVYLDLSDVDKSINAMEQLCNDIDSECPVALSFGIKGNGEGIVFFYDDPHKGPMPVKVKTLKFATSKNRNKKVIEVTPEKATSISEFVEYAATKNRIGQGIQIMRDTLSVLSKKDVTILVDWVLKDIEKEEFDVLAASNLTMSDITYAVKTKCREFYFDTIN